MNQTIVRVLVVLIIAATALPALAVSWAINHPPDDASYAYPESEIFAAGDGPEAEEFDLYLKKDGEPYLNWAETTDAQGVWDRTPLSQQALPVGEYFL
jgi:hypothetical protein